MLTNDKQITTPEYWNKVYAGTSNGAVDNSNTKRPVNTFDRFQWVAGHADGPLILDIASGHAHSCKRIKALHPGWTVYASDQASEAMIVANYSPYLIINAYTIPFKNKFFDTVICSQAMEYMDDQERFIEEARRVSKRLLITVPLGNMEKWSQLRIYTEENVRELLERYGVIEIFEKKESLLLVKLLYL